MCSFELSCRGVRAVELQASCEGGLLGWRQIEISWVGYFTLPPWENFSLYNLKGKGGRVTTKSQALLGLVKIGGGVRSISYSLWRYIHYDYTDRVTRNRHTHRQPNSQELKSISVI